MTTDLKDYSLAWVAVIMLGKDIPYISIHPGRLDALAFAEHEWVESGGATPSWRRVPNSEDITVADVGEAEAALLVYPARLHGAIIVEKDECAALRWALGPLDPLHPMFALTNAAKDCAGIDVTIKKGVRA